jgi:DASH complex subunit DAD2
MSFAPRTTTIRPSSGLGLGGSQNSQSSALQARIHEKKSELESLRQLRDLSAGLADQMQQLEEKLGTLSDGTEAVAAVMANWGSVLRAVSMASGKWMVVMGEVCSCVDYGLIIDLAGIPKPKEDGGDGEEEAQQLPQTLVRIPIHQAEAAQREQEKEAAAGAG